MTQLNDINMIVVNPTRIDVTNLLTEQNLCVLQKLKINVLFQGAGSTLKICLSFFGVGVQNS